jgi:hypothetical protein
MSQSAENVVAAIEQRRIDAMMAADINSLDELIDEQCTHIESNGTSRTKAEFLADVAKREFSFDLFEIKENHIRIFGDTAIVTGTYRNIVRVRGNPNPIKHARHLRVYVNRDGSWKLVAHQATEIAPNTHSG